MQSSTNKDNIIIIKGPEMDIGSWAMFEDIKSSEDR